MPGELRGTGVADMAALGWTEAQAFGAAAPLQTEDHRN